MEKTVERTRTLVPAVDIYEEGGAVRIRMEMPGVRKEDVELRIENDLLSIKGSKGQNGQDGAYVLRERHFGEYYKQFTLDDTIDREKVDASMKNGVLVVTLNKKEAAKPRRIEVRSK